MRFIPLVSAFAIALVGAVAVGLRPGYPFDILLIGAALVSAMTGLAASVLQFLPPRRFLPAAIISGVLLGLLVPPMLRWADVLGFGDVRGATSLVWPVGVVAGLLLSHVAGLDFPAVRRRYTHMRRTP